MNCNERENEVCEPSPIIKAIKCLVCGDKVYTKKEILDYMVENGSLTEEQAKLYI